MMLLNIFREAWKTKVVPKNWEDIIVPPIHQKGEQSDCKYYIKIWLTSVVFKAYTRMIEQRLMPQVEPTMGKEQAEFRSCRLSIWRVIENIQLGWSRQITKWTKKAVKKIYSPKGTGKRSKGRPRKTWNQEITETWERREKIITDLQEVSQDRKNGEEWNKR